MYFSHACLLKNTVHFPIIFSLLSHILWGNVQIPQRIVSKISANSKNPIMATREARKNGLWLNTCYKIRKALMGIDKAVENLVCTQSNSNTISLHSTSRNTTGFFFLLGQGLLMGFCFASNRALKKFSFAKSTFLWRPVSICERRTKLRRSKGTQRVLI